MDEYAVVGGERIEGISLREALLLADSKGLKNFIHNDVLCTIQRTPDGPVISGFQLRGDY